MAGRHKISYAEGHVYEGEWSEGGRKEGAGVLLFADGSKYTGQFSGGFSQGCGVMAFPSGNRYEGAFEVGKFHGYGVFYAASGMKYEGQFQDGHAHGQGLITFADGSHGLPRQEGRFEGDRCVQRGKATEATRKARQMASQARTLQQQLS